MAQLHGRQNIKEILPASTTSPDNDVYQVHREGLDKTIHHETFAHNTLPVGVSQLLIVLDHQRGLLRRNKREEILEEIKQLADTNPEDVVPAESRFLLEFDFGALGLADPDTHQYWVTVVRAARCAGCKRTRTGAQARRLAKSRRRRISLRKRLGIPDVERHSGWEQ